MATIPSISMIPSGYKQNKVYSVLPTNGDGDLDFARTSVATRINENGLIEEMGTGVPRLDYSNGSCPSLLLEPQSTNLYLNSEIIVTQDVTTSATDYTVSFYGTGTITFTGSYSGSLVGSGASTRVVLTFTATSGTLTSTVSGSATQGQIEALGYATSYIKTEGSTVTRVADTASKSGLENQINSEEGVLYLEISSSVNGVTNKRITLSDGTNSNRISFGFSNTENEAIFIVSMGGVNAISTVNIGNQTDIRKIAISYKTQSILFYVNGVKVGNSNISFSGSGINKINFSNESNNSLFNFEGNVKDLRVYKKALTEEELQTLTTF